MGVSLIIIQVIAGLILSIVGLNHFTYKHETNRLTILGWILLACAFLMLISTSMVNYLDTIRYNKVLLTQTETIEEIKEKLFEAYTKEVMKAPKEIRKISKQIPTGQIQIISPYDGSQVGARIYVEGTVSAPSAKIWLIIHPMNVSAYWVQQNVSVRKDGTWKVMAYLGRGGNLDIAREFEIMAVAYPEKGLHEGKILSQWPEARWNSQVISVTRQWDKIHKLYSSLEEAIEKGDRNALMQFYSNFYSSTINGKTKLKVIDDWYKYSGKNISFDIRQIEHLENGKIEVDLDVKILSNSKIEVHKQDHDVLIYENGQWRFIE